jgi:hypothetical protein
MFVTAFTKPASRHCYPQRRGLRLGTGDAALHSAAPYKGYSVHEEDDGAGRGGVIGVSRQEPALQPGPGHLVGHS